VVVQQCGIGLVPVRIDGEKLAFAAPPLLRGGPVDAELLAEVTEVLRPNSPRQGTKPNDPTQVTQGAV
jgi:hypothetical protein